MRSKSPKVGWSGSAPGVFLSPLKADLVRITALLAGALIGVALSRWEKSHRHRP